MQNLTIPFILFACICLLTSCKKEQIGARSFPRLETISVTDITDEGAVFNAHIFEAGSEEILRYGFVWSQLQAPRLGDDPVESAVGAPSGAEFSLEIRNNLRIGKRYFVRAFVETSERIVYGTEISFESLGSSVPIFTSVHPERASWGDTIEVRGKFFSQDTSRTAAFLGEVELKVISTTDSLARFVIPPIPNNAEARLKMIVEGVEVQGRSPLQYAQVEILEIIPQSPTYHDTILVKLNGLNMRYFEFSVEGRVMVPIAVFQDSILFQYPLDMDEVNPNLRIQSAGFSDSKSIFIKGPEVEKLSGRTIEVGQTLRIFATDLYPILEETYLVIHGIQVLVEEYRNDSLFFTLPQQLPARDFLAVTLFSGPFRVILGRVNFKGPVLFDLPSLTIEEFRPQLTLKGEDLTISGELTANLWWSGRLIPISQEQIQNITREQIQIQLGEILFPDPLISTIEDINLIVYAGGQIIRSYPLKLRYQALWTKKNVMPFVPHLGRLSFEFNNQWYIGNGFQDGETFIVSFYVYRPEQLAWQAYWSGTNIRTIAYPVVFEVMGQIYMATGTQEIENGAFKPNSEVHLFNPDALSWSRVADFPGIPRYAAEVMIDQSDVYLLGGKNDALSTADESRLSKEVWKFIPETASWAKLDLEIPEVIINVISVEDKGYISVADGFYRFHETSWTKIGIPGIIEQAPIVIGESVYWGFENNPNRSIKQYNFSTAEFQTFTAGLPNTTFQQYLFTDGGKAYFAVIRNGVRELWTFDPERL